MIPGGECYQCGRTYDPTVRFFACPACVDLPPGSLVCEACYAAGATTCRVCQAVLGPELLSHQFNLSEHPVRDTFRAVARGLSRMLHLGAASAPAFTKSSFDTPELTWNGLEPEWLAAPCVFGGAVGPRRIPAYPHLLCDYFAASHPDAKSFLLRKLTDPNPYLAAYAFKCLIRLRGWKRAEIPATVTARPEKISVQQEGSEPMEMTLGEFILGYFGEIEEEEDEV